MRITPVIRRVAWQRELAHYPATRARVWYLVVTLAIAVTLYSHIFVEVSVLPMLQRELGFTLQQFGLFFTLVFLLSAISSLFGSLSDRLGLGQRAFEQTLPRAPDRVRLGVVGMQSEPQNWRVARYARQRSIPDDRRGSAPGATNAISQARCGDRMCLRYCHQSCQRAGVLQTVARTQCLPGSGTEQPGRCDKAC